MSTPEELEAATRRVNGLAKAPSTDDMLALYGFFKQANAGDATGSRPGMLDPKGRAKFDAWSSRKGMAGAEAKTRYVALVGELAKKLG